MPGGDLMSCSENELACHPCLLASRPPSNTKAGANPDPPPLKER